MSKELEHRIEELEGEVNYLFLKVARLYEIVVEGGPRLTDGDSAALYNLREHAKEIESTRDK